MSPACPSIPVLLVTVNASMILLLVIQHVHTSIPTVIRTSSAAVEERVNDHESVFLHVHDMFLALKYQNRNKVFPLINVCHVV